MYGNNFTFAFQSLFHENMNSEWYADLILGLFTQEVTDKEKTVTPCETAL
jgi:hypothetical protein